MSSAIDLLKEPKALEGIVMVITVDEEGGIQIIGETGVIGLIFEKNPQDDFSDEIRVQFDGFIKLLRKWAKELNVPIDPLKLPYRS